ncbi:hypothetical protein ACRE_076930 [Hapsidospora chrysogenum ATCC 11550]|uniref:Uncharacterized protein n=1 Tax=Hapsidospora chrysogenum (strain ATCC 11550 / CBS 779.69 / DSM 880 / IAM 14645 / JCM 23072 / IMI 49137) TaxID=857340 RepID=A0A086SWW3_HAPC1|nr:hypothetical protein ACRE_076930 [Hapsidospora chrysogenum ATCC 11550]
MPDKRLKGATEYSTHPPTLRVRQRLMNLSPDKRAERNARIQEYNSVRACCARVSKQEEYRRANVSDRRAMLLSHIRILLDKRRKAGKSASLVNEELLVDKHLKSEADARASNRGRRDSSRGLQGVSMDSRKKSTFVQKNSGEPYPAHQPTTPQTSIGESATEDNSPLPVKPELMQQPAPSGTTGSSLVSRIEVMERLLISLDRHMLSQSYRVDAQMTALRDEVRRASFNTHPNPVDANTQNNQNTMAGGATRDLFRFSPDGADMLRHSADCPDSERRAPCLSAPRTPSFSMPNLAMANEAGEHFQQVIYGVAPDVGGGAAGGQGEEDTEYGPALQQPAQGTGDLPRLNGGQCSGGHEP